MQVVVKALLTAYERVGNPKSPSILILHGWGDAAKGWHHIQQQLAEEYDVTVLDLTGFGSSDSPSGDWDLTDYAQFVADFLKKVRIKPHAIIGHSNGGAIAIRGLGRGLLQADKLVLLGSAGIRSEYKGRKKALRLITKAGKVLSYPLPHTVRKRLRRRVYTTVGSDMLVAEHMQETFKKIVTDDVQADAANLSLPTLLVYGENDQHTPPQYGRVFHNLIAGSTLEIIGQAGHFVHLDKPDQTMTLVSRFVR
jgi:pimeloyl-ACP methyl ester carboxylesterase